MQVEQKNHNTFSIYFPSPSDVSTLHSEDQETDTLSKFIQKCPFYDFSLNNVVNNTFNNLNKNSQLIEKFKKQIIAFAVQYGTKNQKTTSIFLKFLEATRDIGIQELKKKQFYTACYYFSICLGFIEPEDEGYLEKFIITKIDIVNKMMFTIFELVKEKKETKYFDWSLNYLQNFFESLKDQALESNLLKSGLMMIELNYFYMGRIYKKKKNISKAIETFKEALRIIELKLKKDVYQKNESFGQFCQNLEIKIHYKLSKCYRQGSTIKQIDHQDLALKKAEQFNPPLHQYLNNKIRMYKSAKQFKELLAKLESKKKIQQMVLKQIEESNQKDINSLYDIYLDRPQANFIPKKSSAE